MAKNLTIGRVVETHTDFTRNVLTLKLENGETLTLTCANATLAQLMEHTLQRPRVPTEGFPLVLNLGE